MGKRVEITRNLGYERNFLVETVDEAEVMIGKLHGVGKRKYQQDAFGISETMDRSAVEEKGILTVLADGMGGLADGEKISMTVVVSFLSYFDEHMPAEDPTEEMKDILFEANRRVNELLGRRSGESGSTVAAALFKDKKVSWITVGDSRIYLYKEGKITQLSKDHNYARRLEEMVEAGEITEEEARKDPQRDALTSYIGAGEEIEEMDFGAVPLELGGGDKIILMSDGVYHSLTEEEMAESMKLSVEKAAMQLGMKIEEKRKKNQDNYTAVIVEMKE